MNGTDYKKDRDIIRELTGKTGKLGIIYYLIGIGCIVFYLLLSIVFEEGKESDNFNSAGSIGLIVFMMCNFAFLFKISGLTPMTGLKNLSTARETFKGSCTQIETLCCIPIRKENVFLYVMKKWREAVLVNFAAVIVMTVCAFIFDARARLWFHTMVYAVVTMAWAITVFFQVFAVTVPSRRSKKIIDVVYIIVFACSCLIMVGNGLIAIISSCGGNFSFYDKLLAVEPGFGAAAALIASEIIVLIIMETIFRKNILKKGKESGWLE